MNSWDFFNHILSTVEDALFSTAELDSSISHASLDFGDKANTICFKIKLVPREEKCKSNIK